MKIPFSFNPLGVSNDSGGGMPTNGLTFYHPLNAYALDPAVGNTLTLTGNAPTATTFNGIDCLQFSNGALIQDGIDGYINFTDPEVTMSIWANSASNYTNAGVFAIGTWDYFKSLEIMKQYRFKFVTAGETDRWMSDNIVTGKWYHLAITFSKSDANYIVRIYRDGTFIEQYTRSGSAYDIAKCLGIGRNISASYPNLRDTWFPGYLACARLYNRALTDEEIALLATELTPHYQITASDLTFSLYQKNESYSISYSSPMAPTFEIIEGELPGTISFNTSNGQFYGKGLTDADHVYNLKVRISAQNSDSAEVNVTIYTYKTARISLYNQSFSFISNKAESKSISYTSDESVTFTIESGTLPDGMTMTTGGTFSSSGFNTSTETQQVVVRATSANNQTGVTATMTLDMQMNAIVLNAQTMKFYTAQGAKTKAVKYSGSLNPVSDAVFSMTGTLPAGVTWDATTGSFTSDGTQSADETASVSMTVSSANGTSTAAIAIVTIEVHLGEAPIADDYVFYMPMTSISDFESSDANVTVTNRNEAYPVEFTTQDGIDCAYFYGSVDRSLKVNNISNSWPFAGTGRTISLWVKCTALLSNQRQGALWYGNHSRKC